MEASRVIMNKTGVKDFAESTKGKLVLKLMCLTYLKYYSDTRFHKHL